ncbi:MAG: protein kinase, partial [Gammaproteobacteria bacterium]|nr:protein kinase [Gammaproteobacteria bacterium]
GSEIGGGCFGTICKAKWRKDKNTTLTIVVKTLKMDATAADQLAFREEAMIISKLESDFIVKAIGVCLSRPVMLAFEYIEGGSLENFLRELETQVHIATQDLMKIVNDALEACVYLEAEGYVHRDIAARNCLVVLDKSAQHKKPKQLKLADFGLAKDIGSIPYRSPELQFVAVNSSAPETLKVPAISDNKSDVWSFGVLLFEIFSWASVPFGHCVIPSDRHINPCHMTPILDNSYLAHKVTVEKYNLLLHPPPCMANFVDSLKEIMTICWKYNPMDRPSFNLLKDLISIKHNDILSICLRPVLESMRPEGEGSTPSENVDVLLNRRPYSMNLTSSIGEVCDSVMRRDPYGINQAANEALYNTRILCDAVLHTDHYGTNQEGNGLATPEAQQACVPDVGNRLSSAEFETVRDQVSIPMNLIPSGSSYVEIEQISMSI